MILSTLPQELTRTICENELAKKELTRILRFNSAKQKTNENPLRRIV